MKDWLEREEPFVPSPKRENPFLARTLRELRAATEPPASSLSGRSQAFLAALHPRAKLFATLGILVAVGLTGDTERLLLPGLWTAAHVAALSRAPRSRVLALGAGALGFSLFLLLPLPFLGQTGAMLRFLAKEAVTVPLVAALGASSRRHQLQRELRTLGAPADLVFALDLTLRALHLLAREGAALIEALSLRRLAPSLSWRPLGGWVGVLFLRTLEMERRTQEALICRGFTGTPPPLPRRPLEAEDWLYLACAFALLAVLALGRTP